MRILRAWKIPLFIVLIFCGCAVIPTSQPTNDNLDIPLDQGAVYLIDEADVVVSVSGATETIIHQKIIITGEKGKQHGTLQISYDSERQSIDIIEAKTITPENLVLRAQKSNIKIVTPAELTPYSVLYPGIKVCTVNLPSVGIGSTVEYTYKIKTNKPLMPGEFWDGFYFQSEEPFVLSRYRLWVPEKMQIHTFPFSVELKQRTKKGNLYCYEWSKENMPAITPEIMMPPLEEIVPRVLVTSIDDWDQIGRWFFNLAKDSTVYDSNLKNLALKLTENKKDNDEKIKAVYHYICKNIRYIGLELGIHGFKPHSAKDVIKLGYGDCKDKAALMVAMLRSINIPSYIALINTDRYIEENIPFPGQFNHAIVAIPKDSSFMILDPTSEVFPYPQVPPYDQNKAVLVPTEGKTYLVKSYTSNPEENKKTRNINVYFDEDGNIEANVKMIPEGIFNAAIRNNFRFLSEEEKRRQLSRDLNSLVPNTTLKSFEIKGIESLEEEVEENYAFTSARYGIKMQDTFIFKPAFLEKIEGTEIVSLEKRNFPIRFHYKSAFIDKICFYLPQGYRVDTYPEPIRITNKFGNYSINVKIENNTLVYQRYFSIDVLEINPQDYIEFRQFYQACSYFDGLPVILKKIH
ncbi:MAG TPA: DUF3857 domain-containing protein [Candidatus Ratteibacteria bacterium]|nr:DUF3857 domain-containing protein [bacterium]HRS06323.1 DUF3857 domain-containing protein [Candidatus Ratteibacteria bacterium]HRV04000.1 DUF3857 domain-containing protein [Candidatus Ratteibacteria bacterium]